eukprot:1192958-Prorocentrum_minimum.AAC.4
MARLRVPSSASALHPTKTSCRVQKRLISFKRVSTTHIKRCPPPCEAYHINSVSTSFGTLQDKLQRARRALEGTASRTAFAAGRKRTLKNRAIVADEELF